MEMMVQTISTIVFILLYNEVDRMIRYKLVEVAFLEYIIVCLYQHDGSWVRESIDYKSPSPSTPPVS